MKTTEIRERFLRYFEELGHQRVPSSSLVPHNDQTLLFTNAGMVQFKDVFLGQDKRPYVRATTSQRCVRAGGKHNDLENVGYTARHHTFFEMLGNFSFGDYFKRDAINYAWNFLIRDLGIPEDKLWVTVFEDDDEAADIWLKEIGASPERFTRIGAHANFWAMGDTGPCGPCSEIFYDHGDDVDGGPPGSADEEGDRYVEIWNLVFMQFNRDETGVMNPLPKPSVDTGMGLERLAAVLQGVHSNYDIDLFKVLIDAAKRVTGAKDVEDKSLRVLADHIRSTAFLIVDGVNPSNEGRGYVLRRIIRRAIRHGYRLGGVTPFFYQMVDPLISEMGGAYPELGENGDRIKQVLRQEEERFAETLEMGMKIFDTEVSKLSNNLIPGALAFRLYDTYGFPVDLTADVARERGLEVDFEGFDRAMDGQREQAREASRFKTGLVVAPEILALPPTEFTGYESLATESTTLGISMSGSSVRSIAVDEQAVVVLDQTPFYAESGGQVGDVGLLLCGDNVFEVSDTQNLGNGVRGHFGHLVKGQVFSIDDKIHAEVRPEVRSRTKLNHSATHLMHAALKKVLGAHVEQKGSLVNSERLRFDFSHSEPVTLTQRLEVEQLVNVEIRKNCGVQVESMALEAAKAAGAEALFDEKYDDEVRVVRMGDFSFELCGGTHVNQTGDIGLFLITAETGVAAGVRRIEAVTGGGALQHIREQFGLLDESTELVRSNRVDLPRKIAQLIDRNKLLEREKEQLQQQLARGNGGQDLASQAVDLDGVKLVVARLDGVDSKALRNTIDRMRDTLGDSVVVLASANDEKSKLSVGVSRSITDKVHAGKLMSELVNLVGGRGGGRPDMAEGGVPLEALDQVLNEVQRIVSERLK